MTNQDDPVPRVPLRRFGFRHPSGELHITKVRGNTATMISCPGQENPVSTHFHFQMECMFSRWLGLKNKTLTEEYSFDRNVLIQAFLFRFWIIWDPTLTGFPSGYRSADESLKPEHRLAEDLGRSTGSK